MANTIFGDGAVVTGASYTGAAGSSAIYSNGQLAAGVAPSTTGVILSTGNAASFTTQNSFQSNTSTQTSTNTTGVDNNAQFNAVAGATTYDASWLQVDFIPDGNVMTINFVFSSEEYPEYSNSVYNDTVGVWINGVNVPLSVGDGLTAVGNVNQTENLNLFQSNTGDQFNTEMDGFTLTLKLTIPVNPGVVNTIKIGIADVADSNYDSNLLIAADSVQTKLVAIDDAVTMKEGTTKIVDVLGNDINNSPGTLQITHINGVAVTAGQSVTLATGQVVTLNADGTFSITTDNDNDTISFTYGVKSVNGVGSQLHNDVGIVTVETIPCFVAGTRILTPTGEVRVEDLRPGDMVVTRDEGARPIRWTGQRSVAATGAMAPVRIAANTFGLHGEVWVSPQHRVLLLDAMADLLFGEPEVLVAAKSLLNDKTVRRIEGGEVTYVHLLFDRHQVIYSEGLATESFLPGPQTARAFDQPQIDEICALFPDLNHTDWAGYGAAARRTLKPHEAQILLAAQRVG